MLDLLFKKRVFIYTYISLLFLLACTIVIQNQEINGVIIFAYIASIMLILSSRLTDAMLPAMLLCVFVTRCYDSADEFIARIPYFIPLIFAIIFHFIKYHKKFRIGRSFIGLCAVTISVTLGGLGTISSEEYFTGAALYHVFGLGLGMLLFYLLVKSSFTEESGREVTKIMYIVGLFASFCIIRFYIADWQTFLETKQFVKFQSDNNLSTFLMFAMPFPLFYASRRYVDILSTMLFYFCIVISGSRGGLVMGTIEFILILLAFTIYNKSIVNSVINLLTIVALTIFVFKFSSEILSFLGISEAVSDESNTLIDYIEKIKGYILKKGEPRMQLLQRMIGDFKSNPVFGVGIGYTGNENIYNPVKGAMNWYHMWVAQVIGGLGIVGILSYGYQLIERIIIFLKNRNLLNFTFLMSYMGLFLMSQVNPGEFCPMPYAALAVTFFIIIEKDDIEISGLWRQFKAKLSKNKVHTVIEK